MFSHAIHTVHAKLEIHHTQLFTLINQHPIHAILTLISDFFAKLEWEVSFPYLFMIFGLSKILPQQGELRTSIQPKKMQHSVAREGLDLINPEIEDEFCGESQKEL